MNEALLAAVEDVLVSLDGDDNFDNGLISPETIQMVDRLRKLVLAARVRRRTVGRNSDPALHVTRDVPDEQPGPVLQKLPWEEL